MDSLGNNHGFLDGNKRIAFTATDVFLRRNGFFIDVEGSDGYTFIDGSMKPAGVPLCPNPRVASPAHQASAAGRDEKGYTTH